MVLKRLVLLELVLVLRLLGEAQEWAGEGRGESGTGSW